VLKKPVEQPAFFSAGSLAQPASLPRLGLAGGRASPRQIPVVSLRKNRYPGPATAEPGQGSTTLDSFFSILLMNCGEKGENGPLRVVANRGA